MNNECDRDPDRLLDLRNTGDFLRCTGVGETPGPVCGDDFFNGQPKDQMVKISPAFLQRLIDTLLFSRLIVQSRAKYVLPPTPLSLSMNHVSRERRSVFPTLHSPMFFLVTSQCVYRFWSLLFSWHVNSGAKLIGWVERKSMAYHTQREELRGFISPKNSEIRVKPNTSSQTIDNHQILDCSACR